MVSIEKRKFGRALLPLIALLYILMNPLYGQSERHPYVEYGGVGLTLGMNHFQGGIDYRFFSEYNSMPSAKQLPSTEPCIGIYYAYPFSRHWSIQTGVDFYTFKNIRKTNNFTSESNTAIIYSVPVDVMYNINLFSNIYAETGPGFSMAYYEYSYLGGNGQMMSSNSSRPYYPALRWNLDLGYPAGNFLISVRLLYSYSLKDYRRGYFVNIDDDGEENIIGTYRQTGSYAGIQLRIRLLK